MNPRIDAFLDKNGFSRGLIVFAIPSHGILFRCRAAGELLDLEFGALFSLLEFITSSLADEKIAAVHVVSSNPEFVFAFTGSSRHLSEGSERRKLLTEYGRRHRLSVGYVEPINNKAFMPPSDYPSVPENRAVNLKLDDKNLDRQTFKPFQKGVEF
ncbi:MAG: hypothetical protein OEW00_03845 [candidate division Zixibacteria bacterium]|nr:hypothetical protein [candidate division Zixibacteria bacterium]